MADRSILYRLRAVLQGGYVAVAQEIQLLASYVGVLNGVSDSETALRRLDGTGIGSAIFTFTGAYSAESSNINEWFGNKQLVRLRCIDSGTSTAVSGAVSFTLPGATALNTAFDALVTLGLPETLRFVIEYTGPSDDFLQIRPRSAPSPQIGGVTNIIVRTGVAAEIEITRTSGTISDYVFLSIGGVASGGNLSADSIKLINPAVAVWDASAAGVLPIQGVTKGNAYRVVNAPSDGSGRFGETMVNNDWVVWNAETAPSTQNSWSITPLNWFVIAAHDVRRITALEQEFLTGIQESPESNRNAVIRGLNYADTANEIRMQIYTNRGDYDAADLNNNGVIDQYVNVSEQNGYLAIRLPGTLSSLTNVLPTLYVYREDSSNEFTELLNLQNDFMHQGDFGQESDFLSNSIVNYSVGDTLRIYLGSLLERYNIPNLDIFESNLSDAVQTKLNRSNDQGIDEQRLSNLETKLQAIFPLTPDVDILVNWANIYDPIHGFADIDIVNGYSLIADHRSSTQRYESAGVTFGTDTDVITYTGLSNNLHRSFGFALPQSDELTLTGTSGTANITINGTVYLATFNTDLTTTASDFVTSHAIALNTAGITVTSNGAVLTFVANDPSAEFTRIAPNATGDLTGTFSTTLPVNKTLMWIVDGGTNIPFVDITSIGTIRVNNYMPAHQVGTRFDNQPHFLTRTSGDQIVTTAGGSLATFTIPNIPSGATEQIRSIQVGVSVYENTTDTLAQHLEPVGLPATNVDASLQTFDARIELGPEHGNRVVDVRIGYTLRVDGANMLIDFTLESAPSGIGVSFDRNTIAFLSYTAQSITARVDDFLTLNDGFGPYSFVGQQEFILSMRPVIGGHGEQTGFLEVVPAAVGSAGVIDQLNDVNIRIPTPLWDSIRVADDIGFKTFVADHYFVHSEVAGLLQHRTERWAYGKARLQTINSGHSFTEAVDLALGSTIGGSPIGPVTVQAELVVYEATGKGTGPGELVSSIVLPANYVNYKYVHITEYDTTNMQFRHAEFPTYILSAGLVDVNDNVRLQGNTLLQWTSGTRTLTMNLSSPIQEILRVSLKD